MTTRRRFVWAAALLAVCTASCTFAPVRSPPTNAPPAVWAGRMSLTINSTPPQHLHTAFELSGTPDDGHLTLLHPLGGTVAQMQWGPDGASLERGAESWHAPTVLQLTQRVLHTALPIQALFDWLSGQHTAHHGWQPEPVSTPGLIIVRRPLPEPSATLRIALDR